MSEEMPFKYLQDNLTKLIETKQVGFNELARKTGVAPTTIKRMTYSADLNPTLESLMALAHYFNLNVSQLIGELPFDYNNIPTKSADFVFPTYVPKFMWDMLSNLSSETYLQPSTIATQKKVSEKSFALDIKSNDSELFNRGGLIIVDSLLDAINEDYVIVAKHLEPPSIKKIIIDGGNIYLKSIVHGLNILPMTSEYNTIGVIVEYIIHLKD